MKRATVWPNLLLIVLGCIWIFPIIWIVLTAFRAESGQFVSYIFPKEYTLDHLRTYLKIMKIFLLCYGLKIQ